MAAISSGENLQYVCTLLINIAWSGEFNVWITKRLKYSIKRLKINTWSNGPQCLLF